ncbi:MAG: DUF6580 family putative transport protein [Ginsengibacter sp.]
MSLPKFNPRTAVLLLMIISVATLRVIFNFDRTISPLSNFSPLGAMALFAGAYFNKKWKAYAFPLATLFLSDVFLSLTVFKEYSSTLNYNIWFWVYGSFIFITMAGRWRIKKVTITSVTTASLLCVLIHWIVSDIGVWLYLNTYPSTAEGYVACLVAAIPYELKFLAGTIIYSAILFGSFEWMQHKLKWQTVST